VVITHGICDVIPMVNVLYFYISTLRSMCAVPGMAVCCSSWISFIVLYTYENHKRKELRLRVFEKVC
jgi:hypothetical protein